MLQHHRRGAREAADLRLTATAYHRGKVALRAPRVLPSRTAVDAEIISGIVPQAICEKTLKAATGKKVGFGPPQPVPAGGMFDQCRPDQVMRNHERASARGIVEQGDVVDPYLEDDEPPFDAD